MKIALVDYNRCKPDQCRTCPAVAACPRKLLVQEDEATAPLTHPTMCKGCGDCARACPHKAIIISR